MERVQLLKTVPIFASLPEQELTYIAGLLHEEHFKKDDYLFFEGDPSHWLYIVKQGKVRMVKYSSNGKDILLEVLFAGEMFGGVAIFDKDTYPASAQAMEPVSVLKLARADFFEFIAKYPTMAVDTVVHLGKRLREAHNMMRSLAVERVEKRIAAILSRLAVKIGEPHEEGIKLDIYLTRQDIADMVGTTVETTIRTMSKFKKDGILASAEDGKILIRDMKLLNEFVEDC